MVAIGGLWDGGGQGLWWCHGGWGAGPRDGGGGQGRGQWYQQWQKVGGGDSGRETVTMAVWW